MVKRKSDSLHFCHTTYIYQHIHRKVIIMNNIIVNKEREIVH